MTVQDNELIITYNSSGYGISVITVRIIDENGEETIMTFNLEVAQITGIEYSAGAQLIYPNPTSGIVHIPEEIACNESNLFIYNVMGILKTEMVITDSNELDLSGFQKGIYLIKTGAKVYKVVKE